MPNSERSQSVQNPPYHLCGELIACAERIGQKLAKQLSGHKIVMYASDLLRAKHTAEIVAKHMGITPNIRTELRERNLGKCVGKSVQWLRENIEVQEKTIDDRMFSDAESRRDEWNRHVILQ